MTWQLLLSFLLFFFPHPLSVSYLLSHHTVPFVLSITTGWKVGVPGGGLALAGALQGWLGSGCCSRPGAEAFAVWFLPSLGVSWSLEHLWALGSCVPADPAGLTPDPSYGCVTGQSDPQDRHSASGERRLAGIFIYHEDFFSFFRFYCRQLPDIYEITGSVYASVALFWAYMCSVTHPSLPAWICFLLGRSICMCEMSTF